MATRMRKKNSIPVLNLKYLASGVRSKIYEYCGFDNLYYTIAKLSKQERTLLKNHKSIRHSRFSMNFDGAFINLRSLEYAINIAGKIVINV